MNKAPPNSEEAERGVIGSIILEPDRVIDLCVNGGITNDSFYVPSNRIIFEALMEMRNNGRPIDLLTISQWLKDTGRIDMAGGVVGIEAILDSTITSAHAEYYIDIVLQKAKLRRMIETSGMVRDACYHSSGNAELILSDSIASFLDIANKHEAKSSEQILKESVEGWEIASKGGLAGIPSPWPKINNRFGGLRNGVVTVFAGPGGMGKSSAIATWLHFLGVKNIPVAACPYEDGVARTYQRIAGIHGDFSVFKLDVGNSNQTEIAKAAEAMKAVLKMPIYLEDKSMNIDQIVSFAVRQKAKNGIKLLVLDAFKDIMREGREVKDDDHISNRLCSLAKRLDIPILVNHHVRKKDTQAPTAGRLTQDDIRGSGQIVSDCRCLILLQGWFDKSTMQMQYEFEVAKNSYGPTGTFPMIRISNRCCWIEKPDITTDSSGAPVQKQQAVF